MRENEKDGLMHIVVPQKLSQPDLTKMQHDQDYLRRQEKRNQMINHQNKSNERLNNGNDERPRRDSDLLST